jgi:hypothetical protein
MNDRANKPGSNRAGGLKEKRVRPVGGRTSSPLSLDRAETCSPSTAQFAQYTLHRELLAHSQWVAVRNGNGSVEMRLSEAFLDG